MYKLFQWNYGVGDEDLRVVVTYHNSLEGAKIARKRSKYENRYIANPGENTTDVWNFITEESEKRKGDSNEN